MLARLADGGVDAAVPDSGPPEAGDRDAGVGADGGTDAGSCTMPLCLTYSLRAGITFRPIVALGPGAFMVAGQSQSGPNLLAVTIDGGLELRPLPLGVGYPWGLAGNSPDQYFIAAENSGATRYANGVLEAGNRCGVQSSFPTWWDVSAPSNTEAVYVAAFSQVCTWTLDAGFVDTDLSTFFTSGDDPGFSGVVALDTGERFIVGDRGALVYWRPPGLPMLARHSVGEAENYDFDAVSGHSVDTIWAVGPFGILAHWVPNAIDGGSWTEPAPIPFVDDVFIDLWVRTNQDIWVVGLNGLLKHFDGNTWQDVVAEGVNATVTLKGVRGTGPDDLVLSGSEKLPDGGDLGVLFYYRRN